MRALSGFLPFLAFLLVAHAAGNVAGLACAALLSCVLLAHARLQRRPVDVLEAGSALLFGALALLAWRMHGQAWSAWLVRLWVDAGMAAIVLAGIALGRPFTLAFARAHVSPAIASSRNFLRFNTGLSLAWALALLAQASIDLGMAWHAAVPAWIGIALSAGAVVAAAGYTWMAAQRRQRAAVDV